MYSHTMFIRDIETENKKPFIGAAGGLGFGIQRMDSLRINEKEKDMKDGSAEVEQVTETNSFGNILFLTISGINHNTDCERSR